MIELNLTYEESRKILKLGYDFSSVCATFSAVGKTLSHGLPYAATIINPFLREVGRLKNLKHLKSLPMRNIDVNSVIPIVPKAALEACFLGLNIDSFEPIIKLSYEKYRYLDYRQSDFDEEEIKSYGFNSAYEAFLWVHENYPEELKKKFEEVMLG